MVRRRSFDSESLREAWGAWQKCLLLGFPRAFLRSGAREKTPQPMAATRLAALPAEDSEEDIR